MVSFSSGNQWDRKAKSPDCELSRTRQNWSLKTTNLGVKSSNLFGRARSATNIRKCRKLYESPE